MGLRRVFAIHLVSVVFILSLTILFIFGGEVKGQFATCCGCEFCLGCGFQILVSTCNAILADWRLLMMGYLA